MCDQPGIVLQTIQWKGTRELVIMQHVLFTYSVQEHNFTDIMKYTEEIQYYQDLLQLLLSIVYVVPENIHTAAKVGAEGKGEYNFQEGLS